MENHISFDRYFVGKYKYIHASAPYIQIYTYMHTYTYECVYKCIVIIECYIYHLVEPAANLKLHPPHITIYTNIYIYKCM